MTADTARMVYVAEGVRRRAILAELRSMRNDRSQDADKTRLILRNEYMESGMRRMQATRHILVSVFSELQEEIDSMFPPPEQP